MKKKKKPKNVQIQWHSAVIDIGVHYCEEKIYNPGKKDHGKICRFWYAYDLTSYCVGSGPTPTKAIEVLLYMLWGTEILVKEAKSKGERVIRNYLHKKNPGEIRKLRAAIRKWKGHIIKDVNWKKWQKAVK